jgi:hypothetical protein
MACMARRALRFNLGYRERKGSGKRRLVGDLWGPPV